MSNIDRGRLSRLNDVLLPASVPDGYSLVYNQTDQKWEAANINGLLSELAPADALPLSGVLTGNPTKYTGKLPTGLSANWYSNGAAGGSTITDLVLTTKSTYTTPNATTTFNDADRGLLKLYINDVLKATIDLGANFVEDNRMGNQNVGAYNTQGNGDAISAGVVTFAEGTFAITSVGKYNNYSKWQKGNAKVVITSELPEGYNSMYLVHDLGAAGSHTMSKLTLYYDDDTTPITFSTNPAVAEATVNGKFLSGVKYYTTGDTFNISYVVDSPFKKAYHTSQVSDYSMQGISSITKNPTSVPAVGDQLSVTDSAIAINVANIMTNDAKVTAHARDPYNNTATSTSPDEGRLILTYSNRSTDITEYFTDEVYRLPSSFDFTSKTASVKSIWNSANPLNNGDAQCYLNGSGAPALVYASTDFSTSFLPSNTANYSTFTGSQAYMRAFIPTGNAPKSNVTITLNGIAAGLGTLGTGDVNVEIKLPGITGWGDAIKAYDSAADKTVDGWGMLAGSVTYAGGNATLTATFGGGSTVNSGNRIYVRVTLRNGNRYITSMNVGW